MHLEKKSKRNRKLSRRKQLRNRRFWRQVIANRSENILEIARRFTKNRNDAQDLAQTVVLRLLKYCPKPVRIINLDAYIFTSTRNAWLDSQCRHKEINFSDLKKADAPPVVALDPNLEQVLKRCDVRSLMKKTEPRDLELLRTKILIQAGYSLPEIATILDEPVRRTRARWYRYREIQQRSLRALSAKNLTSSIIQ